jgi:hypothetical protein
MPRGKKEILSKVNQDKISPIFYEVIKQEDPSLLLKYIHDLYCKVVIDDLLKFKGKFNLNNLDVQSPYGNSSGYKETGLYKNFVRLGLSGESFKKIINFLHEERRDSKGRKRPVTREESEILFSQIFSGFWNEKEEGFTKKLVENLLVNSHNAWGKKDKKKQKQKQEQEIPQEETKVEEKVRMRIPLSGSDGKEYIISVEEVEK